jgi:hypothetical protein
MRNKKSVLMTLNHNCGYFSGVGSGIAGNYCIGATNVGSMLIITHGLRHLPNYYMSENELYVFAHFRRRTVNFKQLKIQVKKSRGLECRGYYIDRKFVSLSELKRRRYLVCKIILPKQKDCPF